MPATSSLIPIISKIHWDDLTGLFNVKITFELKTPLGNFHREVIITAGDLAAAIQAITNEWAGLALEPGSYSLPFVLGDFAALGTALAAIEGPTYTPLEVPTPGEEPTVPDDPYTEWNGTRDLPDGYVIWGVPE